ncbi:MAG: nuclear transport factor 2 family protein [Candidatus Limnocylindria bacterium]
MAERGRRGRLGSLSPEVRYAVEPFREVIHGAPDLRRYFAEVFSEESRLTAWFGEPIVDGERASIEWWATLLENGEPASIVGTSTLRFDSAGLVIEQRDTWNQATGQTPPAEGWGR